MQFHVKKSGPPGDKHDVMPRQAVFHRVSSTFQQKLVTYTNRSHMSNHTNNNTQNKQNMSATQKQEPFPFDEDLDVGVADRRSFWSDMMAAPLVPLGIAGAVGSLGYGVYSMTQQNTGRNSSNLMMGRVFAQVLVVVGIGGALLTTMGPKKKD